MDIDFEFGPKPKLTPRLRAVLVVMSAAPEILNSVLRFVRIDEETVLWDKIWSQPFSDLHKTILTIAQSLWSDQQTPGFDFFEATRSLPPHVQAEILKAIGIRWGLRR